ncbi:hypothetical protein TaPaz_17 [Acinetobacter phage TaPaz]|nr:hypothetical protein TaPaz_17 [Acinetobacter phage TaPaz]
MSEVLSLYSKGTYWLFEHYDEHIVYNKYKYALKEDFLKGVGRILTEDQVVALIDGLSITIPQKDGTTFFFKYVSV